MVMFYRDVVQGIKTTPNPTGFLLANFQPLVLPTGAWGNLVLGRVPMKNLVVTRVK